MARHLKSIFIILGLFTVEIFWLVFCLSTLFVCVWIVGEATIASRLLQFYGEGGKSDGCDSLGLMLFDGVRDVFWIFISKKQGFCLLCRNVYMWLYRETFSNAEDVLI